MGGRAIALWLILLFTMNILPVKSELPQRNPLVFQPTVLFCMSHALIEPQKASLCLYSSWPVCAGRRNFAHFIAGYAEPMRAHYLGVDTGRILGQCSNLSAVTWGQGAAIGGHPYRSVLQPHGAVDLMLQRAGCRSIATIASCIMSA